MDFDRAKGAVLAMNHNLLWAHVRSCKKKNNDSLVLKMQCSLVVRRRRRATSRVYGAVPRITGDAVKAISFSSLPHQEEMKVKVFARNETPTKTKKW